MKIKDQAKSVAHLVVTRAVLKQLEVCCLLVRVTDFGCWSIVYFNVRHYASAFKMVDGVVSFTFSWALMLWVCYRDALWVLSSGFILSSFLVLPLLVDFLSWRRKNEANLHVIFIFKQEFLVLVLQLHPFELLNFLDSFDLICPFSVYVVDLNLQVLYFLSQLDDFPVLLFQAVSELFVVPADFGHRRIWLDLGGLQH